MGVISVSLPDLLLDQTDEFIKTRGYAGRSEIVRAALRDFLNREAADDAADSERNATLTLLYPEGYEKKIGEVRHDYTDIVKSMMHSHTETFCVEVFILNGRASRIKRFADALRALRETELVAATYTDVRRDADASPHAHGGH